MKISVNISMPEPPALSSTSYSSPKNDALPSLQERVEYAIDQIDCKTPSKKAAIEFLRELVHKLEALPRLSECQQHCKKLAQAAISDYGTYYKGMKE